MVAQQYWCELSQSHNTDDEMRALADSAYDSIVAAVTKAK